MEPPEGACGGGGDEFGARVPGAEARVRIRVRVSDGGGHDGALVGGGERRGNMVMVRIRVRVWIERARVRDGDAEIGGYTDLSFGFLVMHLTAAAAEGIGADLALSLLEFLHFKGEIFFFFFYSKIWGKFD